MQAAAGRHGRTEKRLRPSPGSGDVVKITLMLKALKSISIISAIYLLLLVVAGAAERMPVAAAGGSAAMTLSDTGGHSGDEAFSKITSATLPGGVVALYRNCSHPDYARVVQRNVKYAIGGLIKGASMYGSLVSERMVVLLDGTPCSIARYCDGYYVIATRHILI